MEFSGTKSSTMMLLGGGRVSRYLHILHQDLCCQAHLQHPVDDQLAVGRQHVPAPVEVLEPLHLRVVTDWGIQMESEHAVDGGGDDTSKTREKQRTKQSLIQDNGFNRWKSKITEGWSYACDTMWLQFLTRLIKPARRWARVNGIFSRKEIVLILWFNSGPLASQWSVLQRLIENTVRVTKSLPDQSNKTIVFITCSKSNNSNTWLGWEEFQASHQDMHWLLWTGPYLDSVHLWEPDLL